MEKSNERVSDRWALVTGASSGIGLALAGEFAGRGYNILAVSRDAERLAECRKSIGRYGVSVYTHVMDLARPAAAEELYEFCCSLGVRPEVLVNDAGVFIYNDVTDTSQERIDGILCLHVRTVTALCRMFAKDMAKNGGGYILNMASYSMWMPLPGIALYSATKAYIKTFSVAFAKEVREKNVWVTAISPAGVATDFYGLPSRFQRLGLRLGVLMTPRKVARKAARALFRRRKHVVPGWYNRLFIPLFICMPSWCADYVRHRTASFRR